MSRDLSPDRANSVYTNVLIGAFMASSGACAALYELALVTHTVISSIFLLNEFEEKLITVKALSLWN